jgi:large subunit ribosomal protein L25
VGDEAKETDQMDTQPIEAAKRDVVGTKNARRLRQQGRVPAIIYGRETDPIPIVLPAHEVEVALQHGSHLLQLRLAGTEQQYLIKEVQYDYLGTTPIHVDLAQVDVDEVVEVSVPIELRGTPAGLSEGGVLDQVMVDLTVRCKVVDIPGPIRPNVTALKLSETLHVGDLELPMGVEAVHEAQEPVAVIRALAVEVEEEPEAEEAEAQAEPEVIGREKKEEPKEDE